MIYYIRNICIYIIYLFIYLFIYSNSQKFSIFRAFDKLNITVSFTFLSFPISIPVFSLNKIRFIIGKMSFGFTVYSDDRNYLINAIFALIQASLQTVSLQTIFTMFILRFTARTYFGRAFWPYGGSYKSDRRVQHIHVLQRLMEDWQTIYTYLFTPWSSVLF